ncbi:MAG: DUF1402 family protein, partial [Eubacteriales bacterium]|nr:DUF1402 family protein [Eubacteriales bacterium]
IGIGQVLYSTSQFIDNSGYYNNDVANTWGTIPIIRGSRQEREERLIDERTNVFYVAAYIKIIIDTWKVEFPTIAERPDILASLYNVGHDFHKPHSNPGPNPFGEFVQENYNLMKVLLEIY